MHPCPRQQHLERMSVFGEEDHVQFNKSAGMKCEKSGQGHTGGWLCVLSRGGHMDGVILVQEWPHWAGCEVWGCRRMETDGTGARIFLVRECFPLFLRYTKPIDFFFPCWVRSWGISRFSVRRMVMTPGPGSGLAGPQRRHTEPWKWGGVGWVGGTGHNKHQLALCVPNSVFPECVSAHIAVVISSIALCLWPVLLPLRPQMCKWKTKLFHFPWALWIDRKIVPQETQVRKSEEEARLSF